MAYKISLFILTLSNIAKSQTFWKSQNTPNHSSDASNFLGNTSYYLIGKEKSFSLYELNFDDNNPNSDFLIQEINIGDPAGPISKIISNTKGVTLISSANCVARISFTLDDMTKQPLIERYPVQTGEGESYRVSDVTDDGSFFFISQIVNSKDYIAYRLNSESISKFKKFELDYVGIGVSVYQGSPYVIFTSKDKNPRRVYDHTKAGPISNFEASHTKDHDSFERAVLSLSDHGVYVTKGNDEKIYRINFIDGTNSVIWNVPEIGFSRTQGISRVPNTTTCFAGNVDGFVVIFDCIDLSGSYKYFQSPQASVVRYLSVSQKYRILLLANDQANQNEFYRIDDYPCWDEFCETCDDFKPDVCLDCKENTFLRLKNGKCSCNEGYWNNESLKCESCPFPCSKCNTFSLSDCLSCSPTYFLKDQKCVDCSLTTSLSPLCPVPVGIQPEKENLTEKTRTIGLILDKILEEKLDQEEIKKINFSNIFKLSYYSRKEDDYRTLNISSSSYSKGNINLSFEEYLLFSNTEKIKIETVYPLNKFYNSSISSYPLSTQENFYFMNQTIILEITKFDDLSEKEKKHEKKKKETKKLAEIPATLISGLTVVLLILATFSRSSLVFLMKLFQILEILSNFSKINTRLGNKLEIILVFLSEINLPEFRLLSKMSPIDDLEDSEEYYKDKELYLRQINGQRGKMIKKNRDIFIFYGQNFILSLIMIGSWFLSLLLSLCSLKENWLQKLLIMIYRMLFGFYYFDFQIICVAEISSRDILKKQPIYLLFSLLCSMLVIFMILFDLVRASNILSKGKENKKEELGFHEKMVIKTYIDELCEEAVNRGETYLIFDTARFLMIQVFIATLQLLNRVQAGLILVFNSAYFCFVIWKLAKKKIFSSKFTTIRHITSEICILIVLINIFVFSLTEKNNFEETNLHNSLEILSIICICLSVLSELVHTIESAVKMITKLFEGKKKNVTPKKIIQAKTVNSKRNDKERKSIHRRKKLNKNLRLWKKEALKKLHSRIKIQKEKAVFMLQENMKNRKKGELEKLQSGKNTKKMELMLPMRPLLPVPKRVQKLELKIGKLERKNQNGNRITRLENKRFRSRFRFKMGSSIKVKTKGLNK